MRVNSVNNIRLNNNNNKQNFKCGVVPYPEYASAYVIVENPVKTKIAGSIEKLASLFSPKVSKEAKQIKSEIDAIYSFSDKKTANKKLLSVFA